MLTHRWPFKLVCVFAMLPMLFVKIFRKEKSAALTSKKQLREQGVKSADIYISEKLQTPVLTSQLFLSSQSLSSSAAFGS